MPKPQSSSIEDATREERFSWLYNALSREKNAELNLSPQGLLLRLDLEIAFYAGAWISVIVISYAATVDDSGRRVRVRYYNFTLRAHLNTWHIWCPYSAHYLTDE